MSAEAYLERIARRHDQAEINARAAGAFESASCHQHFAAWFRDGTFYEQIHGVNSTTLSGVHEGGLTWLAGDAVKDSVALRNFADHAHEIADKLDGITLTEETERLMEEAGLYAERLQETIAALAGLMPKP